MSTEERKTSRLLSSPRARSRVRWGRRLAATAWKRTSGARATIIMLKMKPAAAEPISPRTKSAPELTRICSLSIITSTAPAKAPPLLRVNSAELPPPPPVSIAGPAPSERFCLIASGSTMITATGAVAMPSATKSAPAASPSGDEDGEDRAGR